MTHIFHNSKEEMQASVKKWIFYFFRLNVHQHNKTNDLHILSIKELTTALLESWGSNLPARDSVVEQFISSSISFLFPSSKIRSLAWIDTWFLFSSDLYLLEL